MGATIEQVENQQCKQQTDGQANIENAIVRSSFNEPRCLRPPDVRPATGHSNLAKHRNRQQTIMVITRQRSTTILGGIKCLSRKVIPSHYNPGCQLPQIVTAYKPRPLDHAKRIPNSAETPARQMTLATIQPKLHPPITETPRAKTCSQRQHQV